MSISYHAYCVSHDPAIRVGQDFHEWPSPAEALAAVADRRGALAEHPKCDIVIARYSSALSLVEVACPPSGHHLGGHTGEQWIDVKWLRLMLAAAEQPSEEAANAINAFNTCWNIGRVTRLRRLINGEEE